MEKSQLARGVCGVGPAERTGKPRSRYCPGGMRALVSLFWRRPRNPREKKPSLISSPPDLLSRHIPHCTTYLREVVAAALSSIWLAATGPGWICARTHSRRHCAHRTDEEGDHEWGDDGHVKDQQTPEEGTHEHGRHCDQAAACFRSAS